MSVGVQADVGRVGGVGGTAQHCVLTGMTNWEDKSSEIPAQK